LARRIRELTAEAVDHRQAILVLMRAWRPDLLTRPGCRPDRGRHRAVAPGPTPAAAALTPPSPCWAGPPRCPASSGQTDRVRLNISGDRQLNQALYALVLTRLRTGPATRAYALRRAQGKTKREIKRCLVRDVARQLYQHLTNIGASS